MPTRDEVLARVRRVGTLPDIEWFDALTRYKEAAATALILKRMPRDGTGRRRPRDDRRVPDPPGRSPHPQGHLGPLLKLCDFTTKTLVKSHKLRRRGAQTASKTSARPASSH